MSASAIDLAERRRFELASEWAPDQRLGRFEQLLADLSAAFIHVPLNQLDAGIRHAEQRIVEVLDLDRCTLSVVEDRDLVHSHDWTEPGFRSRAWFPPGARVSARELFPWTLAKIQAGELVQFSSVEELPDVRDRESYRKFGTKSTVIVHPSGVAGQTLGALAFDAVRAERSWPPATVDRLRLVAGAFAGMLVRRHADESVRAALVQVSHLRDKLPFDKVNLRQEVQERTDTGLVIGESLALRRVEEQVQQVAPTSSTVLLLGETGSGKEMFATQIHELSARRGRPMVRVNCAAIPATLIESELFGREKGAYTGALTRQIGRFEMADHLDDLSRRNRRPAARDSGQAAPRTRGETVRAVGETRGRFASIRGSSPRPIAILDRLIAAGTFREESVLSPLRVPDQRPAAARPRARHTAASVAIRRGVRGRVWQAGRPRSARMTWPRCSGIPGPATSASSGTSSSGP